MDSRTSISQYLADNFTRLYGTGTDVLRLFTDSLDVELNYFQLLKEIVIQPEPTIIHAGNASFPVFYRSSSNEFKEISELPMDCLLVNAFLLLSGWQEFIVTSKDQHDRFPFRESLQFKFNFGTVPVVNIIFNEICRRIQLSGQACMPLKFSAKGSNVIFSHDIDRLYSGWYEGTGNLLKKPGFEKIVKWLEMSYSKFIRGRDDYEAGFYRLLDLLDKWEIRSIFFFLASKSAYDADYDLDDPFIGKVRLRLEKANHLAGIHSGYFTFTDAELMRTQVHRAERVLGRKIIHNRQHFLRFDMAQTPALLDSAGIKYDFSLGFAESAGFRNGIATPFSIFDFNRSRAANLIGIPLFFMDGTYSHYMKVGIGNMKNPLEELVRISEGMNLNFSVLFHNTVFTDFKYAGFTGLFVQMAEFCRNNGISTDAHVVWPDKSLTT